MSGKTNICLCCYGARWVCEAHPDRPRGNEGGCTCGAPGDPCPLCDELAQPEMSDGFEAEAEADYTPLPEEGDEDVKEALQRIAEKAVIPLGKYIGKRVRLFTKNGHDWTGGFPWIVEAALKARRNQFVIEGEAVVLGADGGYWPVSDLSDLT